MSPKTKEIVERIKQFIDEEVRELDDEQYCEALEEVAGYAESGAEIKREEMENE